MKSVGIITFQWYDNYGTVLQAYALQETLQHLGCSAGIVPIEFDPTPGIRRYVAKSLKGTIGKLDKYVCEHGDKRRNQFAAFRRRFFRYVDMPHGTFSQMLGMKMPCDALVFGSDNIWSPWCVHHDDDMAKVFLGDGIQHPVKIAYAASTGGRLARHPRFVESLDRIRSAGFKAVSLRESANLLTFKDAGFKVEQVPDPSLLLTADEWERISMPSREGAKPYVMGYDLGHQGVFGVRQVCECIAHQNNLDVVVPYPKKWWRDWRVACHPGPQKWLSLIRNADCLVTNSFHGVMFALIFNRPFVFLEIIGNDEAIELNMRAREILANVGLEDRIVLSTCSDIAHIVNVIREPIQWASVNAQLAKCRDVGINYLKTNINERKLK